MGISIFPSTAAEFVSNNFVVDMNDTTNNTADTGGVKQAGPYSMSFSSGDTTFDVYFIDADGNSVGYSNTTSITASGTFDTVVILGVASDEVITFSYSGSVNNADGTGDEPGAGAYLTSISPSDLPTQDDTATVIGGNFGSATEIFFDSGTASLAAKSVTVTNGTSLIVTRPDSLDPNLDPWDVRAVNTGVTPPTGTDAHILAGTVDAGAVPVWVTTSPLPLGTVNSGYTATLEATDADGAVTYAITSGSLPTGLSLAGSVISGTPTTAATTFTVTASDDGGNENSREFILPLVAATGGSVSSTGGKVYHTFTTAGSFIPTVELTDADYLIVAGGGGGGRDNAPGGGGAGGLLQGTATFSVGTVSVTVGTGGSGSTINNAPGSQGNDSFIAGIGTAVGGGGGASGGAAGTSGGSGSGDSRNQSGGTATAGQGFDGGPAAVVSSGRYVGGGGGGAGEAGSTDGVGQGGDGITWIDGTTYAGGGGGGYSDNNLGVSFLAEGGEGGGGRGGRQSNEFGVGNVSPQNGTNGLGGGGGASADNNLNGGSGGNGVVIIAY